MRLFGFNVGAKKAPQNPNTSRPSGFRPSRKFSAAAVDRLTASWTATNQAINDELKGDLDRLRARSRELVKNNDYARKFRRMVARNIVGPAGFILQARSFDVDAKGAQRPDSLANSAIETAFFRWARRGSAEVTGRQSFADLCRTIAMAVATDGEALVRVVRGSGAQNPERLAFQLLDIARLDTQRNQAAASGRNAIVMGVEIDGYTRPAAYWLKTRVDATTSTAERIPAGDLLHIYVTEDAEQVRGVPWMHAAMLAMHDLGEFNRSALLAARKGADTLGFIVSPDGTADALGTESTADGEPLQISAPGTYDVLPEGYDIRTPESAYPSAVYGQFVKDILRRVATGLDVAYNGLANDLEGVNYSSIRAGVLEERDQWSTLQSWFIDAFLEPVFDEWFNRAITAGTITMPNGSALPASKADKFRVHQWQGRRWSWVDPKNDIEAARLAVKSGIASPQMIAAQNGVDVEDVLADLAAFEEQTEAKGITLVDYQLSHQQPGAAAPAAADPAQPDPAAKALLAVAEQLARAVERSEAYQGLQSSDERMHATIRSFMELLTAERSQAPAAPVIHLHQGDTHVAPPEVRVEFEATLPEQPAPVVDVRVEATMPEQAAPTVNVTVETPAELSITAMPARVTTSELVRDASGNIISTAQRESDA